MIPSNFLEVLSASLVLYNCSAQGKGGERVSFQVPGGICERGRNRKLLLIHQATMQPATSEAVSPTIYQPRVQATPNLLCWSLHAVPVLRPLLLCSGGADLLICTCCIGSVKCPFVDPLKGRWEGFCPQTSLSTGSANHSLKTSTCNRPAPKAVRVQRVTEQHHVWPSGLSAFSIPAVVGFWHGKNTQIILRKGQPLLGWRNGG